MRREIPNDYESGWFTIETKATTLLSTLCVRFKPDVATHFPKCYLLQRECQGQWLNDLGAWFFGLGRAQEVSGLLSIFFAREETQKTNFAEMCKLWEQIDAPRIAPAEQGKTILSSLLKSLAHELKRSF